MRLGELDQWLARLALYVRRVDDREPGLSQAPPCDEVQDSKRIGGSRLIVFVTA